MNIPNIIKETCEGTVCVPIRDELFRRREIYCTGEIDAESANSIIVQLHFLSLEDPTGEITLYINSPGGEASSGLAVYDTMQNIPAPVRTICMGTAASMAAVLFAAGKQREMLEHSRIMIHDPLIPGGMGGSALKIDQTARNIMRLREVQAEILARHTGHTVEEIYTKTATDSYFDAGEAVSWGLADSIIKSTKGD